LNTCGYYDKLIEFLDHMVEQKFVELPHRQMIQMAEDPEELLKKFEAYQAPTTSKAAWVLEMTKTLE
jgi:predicted Rossmann-fold nucleotide-binding protein